MVWNWVWSLDEATFYYFHPLRMVFCSNVENLKPFSNVLRKLKQFLGSCDPFWGSFDKGR